MEMQMTETARETPRSSRAEKGEVVGGGWFVGTRDKKGRLHMGLSPFEWPDMMTALLEAERMSAQHPGKTFVILAVQ